MKLLLATHFFPPSHAGGTETYTHSLARALLARGHQPAVICAAGWGEGRGATPRAVDDMVDGIPVRRLHWNWADAPDPFRWLYDNPAVNTSFAAYLRQLEPEVVHITSCYSLGAGIIREAKAAGLRTLLTLTDFWFISPRQTLLRADGSLCAGPRSALECQACLAGEAPLFRRLRGVMGRRLAAAALVRSARHPAVARRPGLRGYVGDVPSRRQALRQLFGQADLALAPSGFLRRVYVENGFPADRIEWSPYGLDLSWVQAVRPAARDGRIRFGYVGQIEPIKGVDLLIEAFSALPPGEDAELYVYGALDKNPVYAGQLAALARKDSRIKLLGGFSRAGIAEAFSSFDVLVVPSTWYENAPIVISESFAAGRPVVATHLGGMADLVEHEVNGLLFERGDRRGLGQALQRFLHEPDLRSRLRAGLPAVRAIQDEVEALLKIYRHGAPAAERDDGLEGPGGGPAMSRLPAPDRTPAVNVL